MHFCRVHLIFFGCVCSSIESAGGGGGEWGKRSTRQARVSFGKNVLLLPPPTSSSLQRPKVHGAISWRGRERKSETNEEEEEPDARRGVRGRERTSGEEESERKRKRRRPRETDVQQRRAMQNLTVQGTGASDDGSGNSCSFHPRGILSLTPFFRCTVPVRSLARSSARPPLVA